jgi:hypothetical protein
MDKVEAAALITVEVIKQWGKVINAPPGSESTEYGAAAGEIFSAVYKAVDAA